MTRPKPPDGATERMTIVLPAEAVAHVKRIAGRTATPPIVLAATAVVVGLVVVVAAVSWSNHKETVAGQQRAELQHVATQQTATAVASYWQTVVAQKTATAVAWQADVHPIGKAAAQETAGVPYPSAKATPTVEICHGLTRGIYGCSGPEQFEPCDSVCK